MGMVAAATHRGLRRLAILLVGAVVFALNTGGALAPAPSAPTGVTATPASNQATVSWTAPTNNGGGSITGYTITPYIGGTAQAPLPLSGTGTSALVSGLTNGTPYTFTVKATNATGPSPESSPSAAMTPWDTI